MKQFRKSVSADAVLMTPRITRVEVSRVITIPNAIDLSIIGRKEHMCAHLSLAQTRDLIVILAEALTVELSL